MPLAKRSVHVTIAFLIVVLLCAAVAWMFWHSARPQAVSCMGDGELFQTHVESYLDLNRRFVPHDPHDQGRVVTAAIRRQLDYLGFHFELAVNDSTIRWSAMGPTPAAIHIREESPARYGLKLHVTPPPQGSPRPPNAYIANALRAGRTNEDDPAIRIKYSADIMMAICQNQGDQRLSSRAVLPRDPFLATWEMDPAEWRVFEWPSTGAKARINPCASSEYADDERSYNYWYYWDPTRHGVDLEGRAFDCRKALSERESLVEAQVLLRKSVSSIKSVGWEKLLNLSDASPIRISTMLGYFSHDVDTGFESEKIAHDLSEFLKIKTFEEAKKKLPYRRHEADTFLNKLFIFIWDLKNKSDFTQFETKLEPDHMEIEIRGRFKRSHKGFILSLYYGPILYKNETSGEFLTFFKRAIHTSDIVIYDGHSNLGHSWSKAALLENWQAEVRPLSFQVLALFSCFSYSYFPFESFASPVGKTPGFERGFISVAANYNDIQGRALTGMTDLVDDLFANRQSPLGSVSFAEYLNVDAQFVSEQK